MLGDKDGLQVPDLRWIRGQFIKGQGLYKQYQTARGEGFHPESRSRGTTRSLAGYRRRSPLPRGQQVIEHFLIFHPCISSEGLSLVPDVPTVQNSLHTYFATFARTCFPPTPGTHLLEKLRTGSWDGFAKDKCGICSRDHLVSIATAASSFDLCFMPQNNPRVV